MADDIVAIGLKVDSTTVKKGSEALDDFGKQATKTERATESLKKSTERLARASSAHRSQLNNDIKAWKNANDPARKYRQEIRRVDDALAKGIITERLATKTRNRLTEESKEASRATGEMSNKMKASIIAIAALAAATTAATKLINVAREFDIINASLITVTGSAVAADAAFKNIQEFAATTPFALKEVADAFIKMKALGLDPSNEALTSYGNTAAAMGKSLNQMIEAVADASTMEFERLKEFGIKARQQGDEVAFTFRGVTTTVAKESSAIEEFLKGIGETDFAGAMAQRADSLDGALSNLGDTWDNLFLTISNAGIGGLIKDTTIELSNFLAVQAEGIDGMNAFWDAWNNAEEQSALAVQISDASEELDKLKEKVAIAQEEGVGIASIFFAGEDITITGPAKIAQMEEFVQELIDRRNELLNNEVSMAAEAEAERTESELALAAGKEERLLAIRTVAADKQLKIDQKTAASELKIATQARDARLSLTAGALGQLSALLANGGKKSFEASKILAIAETTVSTYAAAQKAYESQLAIPTPDAPFRAQAAAGLAILSGVARVSAIASTSYGGGGSPSSVGGGGGSISGGGGSSAPAAPDDDSPAQQADVNRSITVSIEPGIYSEVQMRELAEQITQAYNDGVQR